MDRRRLLGGDGVINGSANKREQDSAAALVQQTGPARSTVSWLKGSTLDVIIGADRQARIDAAQTDSRECRNCHSFTAMDVAQQEKRARESHLRAIDRGMTCIDCHQGIAHELPAGALEAIRKVKPAQ